MTNGFTVLIAILLLAGIILTIRFILMHGSKQGGSCTGNCAGCRMGCASGYSPEKKDFDRVMNRKDAGIH